MMTKNFFFNDRFFVSIQKFTTAYVKIVQNSRFFFKNFQILDFSGFFCLNCQIPGKVATLYIKKKFLKFYDK